MSKLRLQDNRAAQRFAVNVPVEMTVPGSEECTVHTTRDISYKGIFVYTDRPLPENSPIRFTMKLKIASAQNQDEGVQVMCTGTVVRVECLGENAGMAATIRSYKFMRPKPGSGFSR